MTSHAERQKNSLKRQSKHLNKTQGYGRDIGNNQIMSVNRIVVNMQEQMGNTSREMEILRKNKEEMLKINNIITGMKNAFDGLLSRLEIFEERISELGDMSVETSKTEKEKYTKRKNTLKNTKNSQELLKICKRSHIGIMGLE